MSTAAPNPWETPLDDSYWNVLLSDVERVSPSSPKDQNDFHDAAQAPPNDTSSYDEPDAPATFYQEDSSAEGRWSHDGANGLASDWDRAAELFESKERIELEVIGCNRGGLLVQFNRLQGFVPASQLIHLPRELNSQARQSELSCRVGEILCLRVIELERERNRLILSERAAVIDQTADTVLNSISEGDILKGKVTSLCGFGAFVDLGGVEGLIHISELSWGRINHPSDVVKPGDTVEVYVLGIEADQYRVTLSLKRLTPDPWTLVEERYDVGQLVKAQITNVVSFGAFARVDEGLEGLIHISELAEGNFLHPRNVVKEGDWVTARVLNIDSSNHRLGLSLRQAHDDQDHTSFDHYA